MTRPRRRCGSSTRKVLYFLNSPCKMSKINWILLFYIRVSPNADNRGSNVLLFSISITIRLYYWTLNTHNNNVAKIPRTYLLMNCSNPFLLSSIKSSSNIPSSPLNGICLFQAFPGKLGTTIWHLKNNTLIL